MVDISNIIEIRDLTKTYTDGLGGKALDGLSLKVKRGEFLSIIRPSGSHDQAKVHYCT